MDEQAGAGGQPVEGMSYTEASAELDAIVGFFEGREVDVDQLVDQLVRATAIIEELDKRLRRTRMQVEQLVPRLAAVLEDAADEGAGSFGSDDDPMEAGTSSEASDDELAGPRGASRGRADAEDDGAPGLF